MPGEKSIASSRGDGWRLVACQLDDLSDVIKGMFVVARVRIGQTTIPITNCP